MTAVVGDNKFIVVPIPFGGPYDIAGDVISGQLLCPERLDFLGALDLITDPSGESGQILNV
jgi:hypothetical protein